jgi:hypothetical protein
MVLRPSVLIYGSVNKSKPMHRVKLEYFEHGFVIIWCNAKTWYYRMVDRPKNDRTYITLAGERRVRAMFWELLSRWY